MTAKVRTTNDGCTLDDVSRMVRAVMPYVDGSATVTFQVTGSGAKLKVHEFKLTNNEEHT